MRMMASIIINIIISTMKSIENTKNGIIYQIFLVKLRMIFHDFLFI